MIFFFTFIPQQKQGTVELNPTHNTLHKRPSIEGKQSDREIKAYLSIRSHVSIYQAF